MATLNAVPPAGSTKTADATSWAFKNVYTYYIRSDKIKKTVLALCMVTLLCSCIKDSEALFESNPMEVAFVGHSLKES
ncbi:MAG: hypothetical protein LBU44_08330 [Mediterranea sp.]|nr:hypothetical protein [Mediterranea sp.]